MCHEVRPAPPCPAPPRRSGGHQHVRTYPAMFCIETLLESDTLCWDRLFAKMGATTVSSARRTADRGRSLGWEAVKEERTPARAPRIPPTGPNSPGQGQREANRFRRDLLWERKGSKNSMENDLATVIKTVNACSL